MKTYKEIIDKDGNVTLEKCNSYEGFISRWQVRDKVLTDAEVSTVFLSLDHNWGEGDPLLYETMIFGGKLDGEQFKYSTRAEAIAGHNEQIKRVKDNE